MKKQALILISAIIFFHLAACLFYYFAKKGLANYNISEFRQFDLLFNRGENQDILFIGSSRVKHGINPLILEKLSGKRILNAGLEGAKINEMEIVLKGYLFSHVSPEKIFLMLDPFSLDLRHAKVHNKLFLASYLNNDSVFTSLKEISKTETLLWKYLPYSIMTEFDDYTRSKCIKGLSHQNQLNGNDYTYKGYLTLNRTYHSADSTVNLDSALHTEGIRSLLRIVKICSAKSIPLQIIEGPYLEEFYRTNKIHDFYKKVFALIADSRFTKTQSLPLNYSDRIDFKDEVHLNATGATKYSRDVFFTFIKE